MSIHFACGGSALALFALMLMLPEPAALPAADDGSRPSEQTSPQPSPRQFVSTTPAEPEPATEQHPVSALAPVATQVLDQQLTGFGNTSPLCLVRNTQVQSLLGLTPEQMKSLDDIGRSILDTRRKGMQQVRRARSPEERRLALEQVEESLQQRHDETCDALREILTPAQWRRLSQLALQLRGVDALFCHDVQNAVGMSDRQRFELVKLADQWRYERRELLNDARGKSVNKKLLAQQMVDLDARMEQRLVEVLNPQQRELFEAMQGEKINWPQLPTQNDRLASRGQPSER